MREEKIEAYLGRWDISLGLPCVLHMHKWIAPKAGMLFWMKFWGPAVLEDWAQLSGHAFSRFVYLS